MQSLLWIDSILQNHLPSHIRHPVRGPGGTERRAKEILVAAHERLWQIQHQEASADGVNGANQLIEGGQVGLS